MLRTHRTPALHQVRARGGAGPFSLRASASGTFPRCRYNEYSLRILISPEKPGRDFWSRLARYDAFSFTDGPMIPGSFDRDGFSIVPSDLQASDLACLRAEASQLACLESSACIRNLRRKSTLISSLFFPAILPPGFTVVRSILFDKTAEANWPVAWHQDLTIAVSARKEAPGYGAWSEKDGIPHVQPPLSLLERMMSVRLHLDDTPSDNGALRVIPGTHRLGKIPSDQVHRHTGARSCSCPCQSGEILLMSPLLLHASSRSKSPSHRRVIHLEFAPVAALHPDLDWHEAPSGQSWET